MDNLLAIEKANYPLSIIHYPLSIILEFEAFNYF